MDPETPKAPMNAATANHRTAYRTAELQTISQRDLLVKLFTGAERFLAAAQLAMEQRQMEAAHNNCQRAKAIFFEMLSTLNFEKGGDIAQQLKELYLFLIGHIIEGNLRKSPALIAEIRPIVATLREGWERIPDEHAGSSLISLGTGHAFNLRT
jgi:flagellar protein FliS